MTALRCSFCDRTVSEVARIVSGPDPARPVHICNECVEVCAGILRDGIGLDDTRKRFKLRRPVYDLSFIIAVLIVVGVVYCVQAYFAGGISHLEVVAVRWVIVSVVAVLLCRGLRKIGRLHS
jgi:hypothetical protein